MNKLILILPITLALAGCQTAEQRAVGTGALAGAAIGAAVADDDDRLEGAIVGGAAGALVGTLIGQAQNPGDCVYEDAYGRRYVAACP
ncbi:glycine zipper domain-containing protein [Defluviimonas sp. WL0050]|uniref:Type IV secretion system putative lipoprotein virB7 n=1 Tax=Albidovulum litorale TaxID=2984134 RepID=A0ABT2ZMP6_9RHOB|nr:glycine zipper domain-containing protein [Defluviimonas sp. WL0050]MCV2872406.1 glycine zipper domain-containing protein [Defluviimonas sp. WL0050]